MRYDNIMFMKFSITFIYFKTSIYVPHSAFLFVVQIFYLFSHFQFERIFKERKSQNL